jgi:hypothetical protein
MDIEVNDLPRPWGHWTASNRNALMSDFGWWRMRVRLGDGRSVLLVDDPSTSRTWITLDVSLDLSARLGCPLVPDLSVLEVVKEIRRSAHKLTGYTPPPEFDEAVCVLMTAAVMAP